VIVTCSSCQLEYDDLYTLTYCPHLPFQMHTKVTVNGIQRCCHSIEELREAMLDKTQSER